MAGDHPAEDQRTAAIPERLVAETQGRRHGGDPVEAIEHGKNRQAGDGKAGIG